MAMGSVGLSAAGSPVPSDLEAIYQGGDFFLDRMKAMAAQAADAKQALADLNLGNDIAAAQAAVRASTDAAAQIQEVAKFALSDAQIQAAKIIADAKARADQVMASAESAAAKVTAAADEAKKNSDAYVSKNKAAADIALTDAKAKQDGMQAQFDASAKAEADFLAAKTEQETATATANAAQKKYQGLVAKMQTVMSADAD